MTEEVAKVFGVPFQVIPFKANPNGDAGAAAETLTMCSALPGRRLSRSRFPRVEGYRAGDPEPRDGGLGAVPSRSARSVKIPPEVEVKASLPTNSGRPSLRGPGASRASI